MFLTKEEIVKIGFKSVGENVLISSEAKFFRPERISIGNNVRIDDNAVIANNVTLHNYIHIAMGTYLLSSPNSIIELKDFTGVSYQSLIISSSDDYYGPYMTNPTIPSGYRNVSEKSVILNKHCVVGAKSAVMPGVIMAEGSTLGTMSLLVSSTKEWKFYFGNPARAYCERPKNEILMLEDNFRNSADFFNYQ